MNPFERIKRFFYRNNPDVIVGEIAENYEDRKKRGEDDPIDKTVNDIITELKKRPEIENALFAKLSESEGIPERIVQKTATRITKDDEIPDRVVTGYINRDDSTISDQSINKIIEEGQIDAFEKLDIISNLDDPGLMKEKLENELGELYRTSDKYTDTQIVEIISKAREITGDNNVNINIDEMARKVVAKKMAENYYSDTSKGTKINLLSRAVPASEMITEDLPSNVEREYKKLETINGKKDGRFDKADLTTLIAGEIGKEIGYNYAETHAYVVPNLENKLSKEDEKEVLKQIQVISKKRLTGPEITEISAQLEGRAEETKSIQEDIIETIKSVPSETLEEVAPIMKNEKSVNTIIELNRSGLLETLNNMPENKKIKTMKTVNTTLIEREKKEKEISQKNEQQKTNNQNEEQQNNDDEQER